MNLKTRTLTGSAIADATTELAQLRMTVFRDWPYLYEGSFEYEKKYLDVYLKSPRSVVVAAYDGTQMIGAATALPLIDESEYVQKPFQEARMDLQSIFYFGESLLLKEYRGQGLGHIFFDGREKAALSHPEIQITTFCAVSRPTDHPLKPKTYSPLDEFWKKRGYEKQSQLRSSFSWQDLNEDRETEKPMIYWMRRWPK